MGGVYFYAPLGLKQNISPCVWACPRAARHDHRFCCPDKKFVKLDHQATQILNRDCFAKSYKSYFGIAFPHFCRTGRFLSAKKIYKYIEN
jgi:hypothetical protein